MRRTSPEDETHRGDDRPTLPPIRDLFGRKFLRFVRHVALFPDYGLQENCLNPYIPTQPMLP
jgi:hypothetical protein